MSPELQMILDERADTTVPLDVYITKSSEEIIYRFAKCYKINDFGLALDMLLQLPPDQIDWKKIADEL